MAAFEAFTLYKTISSFAKARFIRCGLWGLVTAYVHRAHTRQLRLTRNIVQSISLSSSGSKVTITYNFDRRVDTVDVSSLSVADPQIFKEIFIKSNPHMMGNFYPVFKHDINTRDDFREVIWIPKHNYQVMHPLLLKLISHGQAIDMSDVSLKNEHEKVTSDICLIELKPEHYEDTSSN